MTRNTTTTPKHIHNKFIKKCLIGHRKKYKTTNNNTNLTTKAKKYIKTELLHFFKVLNNKSCDLILNYDNKLALLSIKIKTKEQLNYVKSECITMLWDDILVSQLKSKGETSIHKDTMEIITGRMLTIPTNTGLQFNENNKVNVNEIQTILDEIYDIADKLKMRRRHILVQLYQFILNVLTSVSTNIEIYHILHEMLSTYCTKKLY